MEIPVWCDACGHEFTADTADAARVPCPRCDEVTFIYKDM